MSKYYTLVGSRETPLAALVTLTTLANVLAKDGWIGRSGGADGADSCLEDGCDGLLSARMEVYLPWYSFNGRTADNRFYIDASKMNNYKSAQDLAEYTHPAWERCSRGARALHSRNVYQVLGKDLNTPSTFLLCWAQPTKTGVKGGTNTAVQLAKKHGSDIINLYGNEDYESAYNLVKEYLGE